MEYNDILRQHGRPLSEIGIQETALDQEFALAAVQALRDVGIPILGGDVYKLKDGKIKGTYDKWYCQSDENSTKEEYLRQSWVMAERFIQEYPDPKNGTILYVIVTPI